MKKIISLFCRNYDGDKLVRPEIVDGAEWVIDGEGIGTEKFDGTACLIRNGELYKRYDAKLGKIPPIGWEPAQDPDPITKHWPGWIKIGDGPEDKWFRDVNPIGLTDGTYELVGPKFQANPHKLGRHELWKHGSKVIENCPRFFEDIKKFLANTNIEGIVWHREDGDMVKIKARDFGLQWPR